MTSDAYVSFRDDLAFIIESWGYTLQELGNVIRCMKKSDKKFALLIEHQRFVDLLEIIKFIHNDKEVITRNSRKIASVRNALLAKQEYESIGDDIEKLLENSEKDLEIAPDLVKKTISLLKIGYNIIPMKKKNELIDKINELIVKIPGKIGHGIVLQLGDDELSKITACFNVFCYDCKWTTVCSGSCECDIYAPIKCAKCGSCMLSRSSGNILTKKKKEHNMFMRFIQKVFARKSHNLYKHQQALQS